MRFNNGCTNHALLLTFTPNKCPSRMNSLLYSLTCSDCNDFCTYGVLCLESDGIVTLQRKQILIANVTTY